MEKLHPRFFRLREKTPLQKFVSDGWVRDMTIAYGSMQRASEIEPWQYREAVGVFTLGMIEACSRELDVGGVIKSIIMPDDKIPH